MIVNQFGSSSGRGGEEKEEAGCSSVHVHQGTTTKKKKV
jgi:hypothetical protein